MDHKKIKEHPLLDKAQRVMCTTMARRSELGGDTFELLDFAKVALRATGNDYAEVTDSDDIVERVRADRAHQRAAVLYVYEALQKSVVLANPGRLAEMLEALEGVYAELP